MMSPGQRPSFRIPEEIVNAIKDRTDIVEVVGRHVKLRRAGGGNWKGPCPFHDERTGSFNVNAPRRMFHCFGCGESGDVIQFLMEVERRDFLDVVRELAGQLGIELTEGGSGPSREEAQAHRAEKDRLLLALFLATEYFEGILASPAGERARAYLAGRGISPATQQKFRVGYALPSWEALLQALRSAPHSIPEADLRAAGLVGVSPTSGRHYDFFRDRVTLPVMDRHGNTVGFASRLLDPDAKDRKYVNSPDGVLFHKKEQLYGLHQAQDAIRKAGHVVLVEGNFDVLALHEAGIEEAVAPMGTALTPEQGALLRRYVGARGARHGATVPSCATSGTVTVAFDGDAAGQAATRKSAVIFATADIDARAVRLPPGDDPDTLVRRVGAGPWRALEARAEPVVEAFLRQTGEAAGSTIEGRLAAIAEAKEILLAIADATARDLYTGVFARSIGMAPGTIARALRGGPLPPAAVAPPHRTSAAPVNAPDAADLAQVAVVVVQADAECGERQARQLARDVTRKIRLRRLDALIVALRAIPGQGSAVVVLVAEKTRLARTGALD